MLAGVYMPTLTQAPASRQAKKTNNLFKSAMSLGYPYLSSIAAKFINKMLLRLGFVDSFSICPCNKLLKCIKWSC